MQKATAKKQATENELRAERCFQSALNATRRQKARLYELRATVCLGRLWAGQGKKEEAREMLDSVYGWFTEGFDKKDLREAKALLEELA